MVSAKIRPAIWYSGKINKKLLTNKVAKAWGPLLVSCVPMREQNRYTVDQKHPPGAKDKGLGLARQMRLMCTFCCSLSVKKVSHYAAHI